MNSASIEIAALKLWNAAKFSRRAPDRDQRHAKSILASLIKHPHPAIKRRAAAALKEILR